MALKLVKVVVQVVAAELDESGKIVGEQVSPPKPFYSEDTLVEFYRTIEAELEPRSASAELDVVPVED